MELKLNEHEKIKVCIDGCHFLQCKCVVLPFNGQSE